MGSTSISSPSSEKALRARGHGASSENASKKGSTPKLVSADPKKTGLCSPAKNFSLSKGLPASWRSSRSSLTCDCRSSSSESPSSAHGTRLSFALSLPPCPSFSKSRASLLSRFRALLQALQASPAALFPEDPFCSQKSKWECSACGRP